MTEAENKSVQIVQAPEKVVVLKPNQLKVLRWRALGYSHEQIATNFKEQLDFAYSPEDITKYKIASITKSTMKAFGCKDEVSTVLKAIEQGSLVLDDPKDPIVTSGQVALVDHLSDRERQVLEEMLTGAGNIEIARRLGISGKTVKNHLTSIREVLQTSATIGKDRVRKAVLYYAWKQLHPELVEGSGAKNLGWLEESRIEEDEFDWLDDWEEEDDKDELEWLEELELNEKREKRDAHWFEEADFDAVAAIDTMLTDGVGVIVSRPNFVEGTEPKAIVIAAAKSRSELLTLLTRHKAVGLGRNIGKPDALHFANDNTGHMYAVVTIDSTKRHDVLTSDVQEIIRQALVDASSRQESDSSQLSLQALRRLNKLRRG